MQKAERRTLILAGVMFVVTVLLTWLLRVDIVVEDRIANYWTMGDVTVYISAALLGGPWGALAVGLGAALADVIAGQAIYAPASFVLKGLMTLLCAGMLKRWNCREWLFLLKMVGVCGGVMTLGYFLYDLLLRGDYMLAALGLPINLLRVIASAIVAVPVLKLMQGKSYEEADPFDAPAQSNRRQLK